MAGEQEGSKIDRLSQQWQRRRILSVLSLVFLVLIFIFSLYWLFVGRFYETTDDAYVSGNLVQVMPRISGQVSAIFADETSLVKKGMVLVTLDKVDAEIALKNVETQLAVTARQVSQFYQNVGQLQAKVKQQEDILERTQDDYKRRQKLVVGKVITTEDLEHARISVDSARAALDLAKHQLEAAIALVANSDLYHHPQIQQIAVRLRNAYLNLKRTTIYAPETGYVAKRPVQVGQQVNPNTVLMIIVPLNQVWIDANFKESQLSHFRIDQPVELISDIYGSHVKYQGRVIGLNPGAGNSFSLLPPQNATGNWIKIVQRLPVRIAINSQQLKEHPLRVGLSMTVTVDTHDRQGHALAKLTPNQVIYQTQDYNAQDLAGADQLVKEILEQNAQNISLPIVVPATSEASEVGSSHLDSR